MSGTTSKTALDLVSPYSELWIRQHGEVVQTANLEIRFVDHPRSAPITALYGYEKDTAKAAAKASQVWLIEPEPEHVKPLKVRHLRKFSQVYSPRLFTKNPSGGCWFDSHVPVPWLGGVDIRADRVLNTEPVLHPIRHRLPKVLIISSSKAITPEHRRRLRLIESLTRASPDMFEVWGEGIRYFSDKWDLLQRYAATLVIENGCVRNYWSEKLADALLVESHIAYVGCTNIRDFFSSEALVDCTGQSSDQILTACAAILERQAGITTGGVQEARRQVLEVFTLPRLLENAANLGKGQP